MKMALPFFLLLASVGSPAFAQCDSWGLIAAVQGNSVTDTVRCLSDGVDPNTEFADERLIVYAVRSGYTDVAKAFLNAHAEINMHQRIPLLCMVTESAAKTGNLDLVSSFLAAGADPNVEGEPGIGTALDCTVRTWRVISGKSNPDVIASVLELLIAAGGKITSQTFFVNLGRLEIMYHSKETIALFENTVTAYFNKNTAEHFDSEAAGYVTNWFLLEWMTAQPNRSGDFRHLYDFVVSKYVPAQDLSHDGINSLFGFPMLIKTPLSLNSSRIFIQRFDEFLAFTNLDLNMRNKAGGTFLAQFVYDVLLDISTYPDFIRVLQKHGLDIFAKDKRNHDASYMAHPKLVDMLCGMGIGPGCI